VSEEHPIRVMIVDDHALLRTGLRLFLNEYADLDLAGEAGSGKQALSLCAAARPDVILMDMVMPDMDGVEATRLIRQQYPDVQIIALTSFQNEDLVEKAIQAGAIGYLLKNVSATDLACAIRQAHAGQAILAQEALNALISITRARADVPGCRLSKREKEVLALLTEGLSNSQIAERLGVSLVTVKSHVGSILDKLGVSTRTEAVALALEMGLLH
jgi:NarL family two-component system response regulator LiaR